MIFLWRPDHVKALGAPGTDRVGNTERSTTIKAACRQQRPIGKQRGDVGRRQNRVAGICRSTGAAEDQVATRHLGAADNRLR